ncbi:hypothetical protein ACERII_23955 [Evansella sp. AB-rgal1]|uniref:hypothetical protein n=1 Tax=Evansella sp. AB-rgal1 TaxID=3242696 RepID=UPI00359E26D4
MKREIQTFRVNEERVKLISCKVKNKPKMKNVNNLYIIIYGYPTTSIIAFHSIVDMIESNYLMESEWEFKQSELVPKEKAVAIVRYY